MPQPEGFWKLTAIIQSKGILNCICFAVYALLLLEVFNIASGSWYAMIDLINRLFSILIKKETRNGLHLHRKNSNTYLQFCCRTAFSLPLSLMEFNCQVVRKIKQLLERPMWKETETSWWQPYEWPVLELVKASSGRSLYWHPDCSLGRNPES